MPGGQRRAAGAVFHPITCNSKLAPQKRVPYHNDPARFSATNQYKFRQVPIAPFCSSTYVSIHATCSDVCVFKDHGCYVQTDRFMSKAVKELDSQASQLDGFEVILNEAWTIDTSFPQRGGRIPQDGARGGRDLRLHIGGDTPTPGAAAILADVATRWRQRGGGWVWSFTHGWRTIHREAFGPDLSVLASVENPRDARRAMRRGYAAAMVVDMFERDGVYQIGGLPFIPCPNETRARTCVECRLCLDDKALVARGVGILFAAHGTKANQVKDALVPLGRRKILVGKG